MRSISIRYFQYERTGLSLRLCCAGGKMAAYAAIAFFWSCCFVDVVQASSQSRRVVVHPVSGIALSGHDPVAYFTEQKALIGKRENEFVWKGVSWLFVSKANRAVFEQNPEIYAPQYGGHGALAMARGFVASSDPKIWALYKDRLYLFFSYTRRAAWVEGIDQHITRGDVNWSKIEPTLAR